MDFAIDGRIFSAEEKSLAKNKLLEVSEILRKWKNVFPNKKISEIKSAFLKGEVLVDNSDWIIDQKIIYDFSNKIVPEFNETMEIAILRSFVGMCKLFAKKSCARVSAQTGIKDTEAYEDLVQDAIRCVLNSMYYYSRSDIELSTFIGESLKKELRRCVRYSYCSTSPVSEEDNIAKIQLFELIKNNPGYSYNQIVDAMAQKHGLNDESKVKSLLQIVVRENNEEKKMLSNIPCRADAHEEVDCLDTVDFLKKIFSPEGQAILNLSDKEIKIFKYGVKFDFERGWMSRCTEQFEKDGEKITKQRVSQLYISAVQKIRPFLAKACG